MHIDNYPTYAPADDVWITVAPTISTGHLPKAVFESFQDDGCAIGELGAMVLLEDLDDTERYINCLDETTDEGKAIVAMMDRFRILGYTHVRFAPAGDVIDGLPTYNW